MSLLDVQASPAESLGPWALGFGLVLLAFVVAALIRAARRR